MTNPRPDIENWWAVEAMIASYNHVYQTIYNTYYEERGAIGVSVYKDAPIASFHYEFLGLSADLDAVTRALDDYPVPADKQFVINVFHPNTADPAIKQRFSQEGMEFVRTGPILGYPLTAKAVNTPVNVHKARSLKHTEVANNNLTAEGERIHVQTLWDKDIHNFYVKENGQAVGWVQLVTKHPGVGYINQLYVMKDFRQRKLGMILVKAVHAEAIKLGLKQMVAVPSDMSIPLFRRMGYRPLLFFSAFQPLPLRKFPQHDYQSAFSHTQH